MDRFEQLVQEFLGKKRVAVWGVEEVKSAGSGHLIVDRLHKQGIQAIAVNPRFSSDPSQQRYSSLTQIEPGIDAVLVYVDRPQTLEAINDCIAAKVPLVWLHDALSPGAAIPEAIEKLRAAGCTVIPGLCPMLYLKPVDPAHFCLKCMLWLAGKSKRVRRNTV